MGDVPGERAAMRLREEVRPGDAEAVVALVTATGFFSAAEIAIARELVDAHLQKGAASGYRFVFAESGAALAGYACFGPVPATASSFDLYWIAVAPAWQGRGVGRRLLERVQVLARAAGGERLYAETSSRHEYAPTLAFYAATGFARMAFLPEHFASGDGKIILEKPLSGNAAH